jgi:hypothetical protein
VNKWAALSFSSGGRGIDETCQEEGSPMNEDQETVRRSIEDGDFDIEWIRSTPEVLFWPGEPFDTIVKRVSLSVVRVFETAGSLIEGSSGSSGFQIKRLASGAASDGFGGSGV